MDAGRLGDTLRTAVAVRRLPLSFLVIATYVAWAVFVAAALRSQRRSPT